MMETLADVRPLLLNHQACFVKVHFAILDLTQQVFLVLITNCEEISSEISVLISRKSECSSVMSAGIEDHARREVQFCSQCYINIPIVRKSECFS
jgi:hypothetical protein